MKPKLLCTYLRPPRSSETSDMHLVPSILATLDKDYLLILSTSRKIIHNLKTYINNIDIIRKCVRGYKLRYVELWSSPLCAIVVEEISVKLTVNVDHNPLADCWRNSIRCYAKVGTHLGSCNLCQFKYLSLVWRYCNKTKTLL